MNKFSYYITTHFIPSNKCKVVIFKYVFLLAFISCQIWL